MSAVNVTIQETIEQVTVAVKETVETVTVAVTAGADGATGAAGADGATGAAGADGATGAAGADGLAGADGPAGADGSAGAGVPIGGAAGQSLTKIDNNNYNAEWTTPSGGKFVSGTNPDDAVYLAGRVGIGVALPVAHQHIQGNDAAVVVQRVQGSAGQTANLAEWRNAGGKTLVEVSAEGVLNISANNDLTRPTASIYVASDIINPTTNALYITSGGLAGRMFLGAVNETVTLELGHVSSIQRAPAYVTGNFAFGGIGNSHGLARVLNDVAIWTSSSNGRLLHYTKPDGFGPRGVLRYVVLPNGNFGIGVEEPTEKLHVDGKIKATSINFSGLPTSAAGLEAGDVWNDNGFLKIV